MVEYLNYAIIGITATAYLWGAWLCLPFVEVHEGDEGKAYFRQRIKTSGRREEDHFIPRWYAFPYFANVAVIAAVAWLVMWLLIKLMHL
jgi:hypothetical protein